MRQRRGTDVRAEVLRLVGSCGVKLGKGEGLVPTVAPSSAPRRVGHPEQG